MCFRLYVAATAVLTLFALSSCSLTSSKSRGGGNSSIFCNSESCLSSICTAYNTQASSNSEATVCKIVGNCEIPNMPVSMQMELPVNGSLACGPTSVHMALESLIKNNDSKLSGWMETYDEISASTSSSGCPASDIECKKIVAVGDKLINGSWAQDARAVSAVEVSQFFNASRTELYPAARSFQTGVFPDEVDECSFVTGANAISNEDVWNNVVLYLNYDQIMGPSSTYSNAPLTEISFKPFEGGHFITLNGYNTTSENIIYKFHCPIYGIKWYYLKQVKLNQPFCVKYSGDECKQYIKVTQLPQGFGDSGTSTSFSYLFEMPGEEVSGDYVYKIIASVSGIK